MTAYPTFATIIYIPDEEANLRDALNVAEPADTIMVEDEEYDGNDNTNLTIDSPVTIMSVNGPENVVFDVGGGNADWITIEAECTIIGLTIINAINTIRASNVNNIEIKNCIIVQSSENGIILEDCDQFRIIGCQFIENGPDGSALRTEGSGGIISNCIFDSNSRNDGSGGGLHLRDSDDEFRLVIEDCTFNQNVASNYGGAIYITEVENCLIKNCQLMENSVDDNNGGGACITGNSRISLETCIILQNETTRSGGGVYISGGSIVNISHSIIAENVSGRSGGGLFVFNGSEVDLFNNIISGNRAGIDGGGLALTNNSIGDLVNCDFVGNELGIEANAGMGGGFYSGSGTVSTVLNCILSENEADVGDQMYTQNAIDITVSFTCIEGGVDPDDDWEYEELIDEDNIDEEPGLIDRADPVWGLNGFFIEEDSPCIDAGSGEAVDFGLDTLTTQEDFAYDTDMVDIGFHYNVRWFDLRGRLFGTVTNIENDDPLANAHILTSYGQEAVSDEDGAWEIADAMAFPFNITTTLLGFNTLTLIDRNLEFEGETEINFELTHPEFSPSIEFVSEDMNISDTTDVNFEIENTGNGPLTWSAQLNFGGDEDFQAWDPIYSGDAVEGLRAIAYVNEIYIMSISTRDGQTISIRNSLGDILYDFDQPGIGLPMTDLAWDGDVIWGARGREIYGFTLEGEEVANFRGPRNPNIAITWDSELEYLWIVGDDSDIFGYDLAGNLQQTIDNPNGITYRGLSFWEDDPDDYNLYVLYDLGENDPRTGVLKINRENEGTMIASILEPENGDHVSGGYFSAEFVAGSIVFIGVTDTEDGARPDVWQVDQIRSWLSIEPLEGAIDPEDSDEMTIALITNAFIEGVYEANVVFSHNAAGGETIFPVSVEVTAEPFIATRIIPVSVGWNLISVNLQSEDPDFRVITEDLVAARMLVRIKDQHGHFFSPDDDFYNMEGWAIEQGYWVLVNSNSIIEVTGMTVRGNSPIELQEGWQLVSYYPRHASNPIFAFSGVEENLTLAKDGTGAFYVPEFNFSNIDICKFGKGYMLNMASADELIWNLPQDDEVAMYSEIPMPHEPEHFRSIGATGSDMSMLLLMEDTQMSGEIGVFVNGVLVGSGVIFNQQCGITIRGLDTESEIPLGAAETDELELLWWDGKIESQNFIVELMRGNLSYRSDALTIAKLTDTATPVTFALNAVYPNPFNSNVRISYSIPEAGHVSLSVFNLLGREVAILVDNNIQAGRQEISFSADMLSTGVYFVRLAHGTKINIQKITCLK